MASDYSGAALSKGQVSFAEWSEVVLRISERSEPDQSTLRQMYDRSWSAGYAATHLKSDDFGRAALDAAPTRRLD